MPDHISHCMIKQLFEFQIKVEEMKKWNSIESWRNEEMKTHKRSKSALQRTCQRMQEINEKSNEKARNL